MRRTHAGFTGLLLAGSLALAGCSTQPAQAGQPSAEATPTVTVLRASQADRDAAAAAMRAVTDHYGVTAWASAKALAELPTPEDRVRGGGYAGLMDLTDSKRLDASTVTIAPLLSGKRQDDFEAWQEWQGRMVHLISALQLWGGGDEGAEADARVTLEAARAAIERVVR